MSPMSGGTTIQNLSLIQTTTLDLVRQPMSHMQSIGLKNVGKCLKLPMKFPIGPIGCARPYQVSGSIVPQISLDPKPTLSII